VSGVSEDRLPDREPPWRVFISHTWEMSEYPTGRSFIYAVKSAVSACGHVIVEMEGFPARDQTPAALCQEKVESAQVYLGVLGLRYGSAVRDRPGLSYTEFEFDCASNGGVSRLLFVLDDDSVDHGIPPLALVDERLDRQRAFRQRVDTAGLVRGAFRNADHLANLVERALGDLLRRRASGSPMPSTGSTRRFDVPPLSRAMVPRPAKLDEIVAGLLAGSSVTMTTLKGAGGVGKTVLAQQVCHDASTTTIPAGCSGSASASCRILSSWPKSSIERPLAAANRRRESRRSVS